MQDLATQRAKRAEQLEQLLKSGMSFADAVNEIAPPTRSQTELMRRASAARAFDRPMFEKVIASGVRGSFDEFVRTFGVERVQPGSDNYRVADSVAADHLQEWVSTEDGRRDLVRFMGTVYEYLRSQKEVPPLELLHFQIPVDPSGGLQKFDEQFAEADAKFDIATSHALVQLLRELEEFTAGTRSVSLKLLSPDLRGRLTTLLPYVAARGRFIEDWVKSDRYLDRTDLSKSLRAFLEAPGGGMLPIYGAGGRGKTMFLRWLVARHCVTFNNRIPVAKVDFDDINVAKLEKYPWLVLVRFAEQLNRQMALSPFRELLDRNAECTPILLPTARLPVDVNVDGLERELQDWPTRKDEVLSDFASAIGSERVVVMLDTVEEAVLHFPGGMRAVLDMFEEVQRLAVPQARIKLIVAGRYDLKYDEEKKFLDADDRDPVEVGKFTPEESTKYIKENRKVAEHLVQAIVDKADGNPFILSLIADLVDQKDLTEVKQIEELTPEYAYLIYRIIDRIPNSQRAVRWVIRYGVVPRQLSPEFLQHVMQPHLRRELEGDKSARRDSLLEYAERFSRGVSIDIDKLWNDLQRYADATGWLRGDKNSVRFQPEVVEPMRRLLANEGSIYSDLQSDAALWFEDRAREHVNDPVRWASDLSETFFHRFQLKEVGLERWWIDQLGEPQAQISTARQPMLEVVTSVAPSRDPMPRDAAENPLLSTSFLAEVELELAKRRAGIGWDPSATVSDASKIRSLVASARTRSPGAANFAEGFALVDASLAIDERDYDRALTQLESVRSVLDTWRRSQSVRRPPRPTRGAPSATPPSATRVLTTDADQFAFHLLRARALAGKRNVDAQVDFEAAWEMARARDGGGWNILAECGRELGRMGRLSRALTVFEKVLAGTSTDGGADAATYRLEASELCLDAHDYERAHSLAREAYEVVARNNESDSAQRFRISRVLALCALETGRIPDAETRIERLKASDPSALQRAQVDEARGRLAAATYDVDRACSALLDASRGYASVGDQSAAVRALLRAVWAFKELKGDWRGARTLIQRSPDLTSDLLTIERVHLDHLLGENVRYLKFDASPWALATIALLTSADRRNRERFIEIARLLLLEDPTFRRDAMHCWRWFPRVEDAADLTREINDLVVTPNPAAYDFFPHALGVIEARRCIGAESARDLLRQAYIQATTVSPVHDQLIEIASRMGAELPDLEMTLRACAAVKAPAFGAGTRIRLASALIDRRDSRAQSIHDQVDRLPVSLKGTQLEAFHLLNRSRLLAARGRDEEARTILAEANAILRPFGRELPPTAAAQSTRSASRPPNAASPQPSPGLPPSLDPPSPLGRSVATAPSPPSPVAMKEHGRKDRARVSLKGVLNPFKALTSGQIISSAEARVLLDQPDRVVEFAKSSLPKPGDAPRYVDLAMDDASTIALPWEWAESDDQLFFRSVENLPEAVGNRALKIVWTRLPMRLRRSLQVFSPLRIAIIRPHGSIQQASQRGFDVSSGRSLAAIYRRHGANVFESPSLSAEGISRLIAERNPQVIHIQAAVTERRGAFGLDLPLESDESDAPKVLTADFWAQQFRTIPSVHEPVVILDPPRPPSDVEVARQLMLRNMFGADLAMTGTVRGVLCAGLFPPGSSELAAERLAFEIVGNPKFQQLLSLFRAEMTGDRFCTKGAALFVSDPEALIR